MYTLNGCHGGDGQVDPSHPRRFTSCKYEQNLMSSRHTVELKRREEDEECPTGSVGDANIYTYCMLHVAEITGLKRVELWGVWRSWRNITSPVAPPSRLSAGLLSVTFALLSSSAADCSGS